MTAIIDVFIRPGKFFGSIKEKGMKKAFWYFAVLFLFFNIMTYISLKTKFFLYDYLFTWLIPKELLDLMLKFTIPELYLQQYLVGLVLPFIIAGILLGYTHIFGGKGSYAKTYQMYIYARTPAFLFGWLPYLGTLAYIYQVVLLIVGTVKIHKISKTKSIWMYVIPTMILLLLAIVVLVLFKVIIGNIPME
jgi:hypothetical protein